MLDAKKVFISHSSKDKDFVKKLSGFLLKHGIPSWVDEAEIRYGDSLNQKISKAIETIDIVIAVISTHSVESSWVRQELDWAMSKEIVSNKVVIIPIIIDKCDVPFFLCNKLYADFTDQTEYLKTIDKLVHSIHYHRGKSGQLICSQDALPGKSVNTTFKPTYTLIIQSLAIIFIGLSLILGTYFAIASGNSPLELKIASGFIYFLGFLMIGSQFLELIRATVIRILISQDAAFGYDIGNIRFSGLFNRKYRKVIHKYWKHGLIKLIVVGEVANWIAIAYMAYSVYEIALILHLH